MGELIISIIAPTTTFQNTNLATCNIFMAFQDYFSYLFLLSYTASRPFVPKKCHQFYTRQMYLKYSNRLVYRKWMRRYQRVHHLQTSIYRRRENRWWLEVRIDSQLRQPTIYKSWMRRHLQAKQRKTFIWEWAIRPKLNIKYMLHVI